VYVEFSWEPEPADRRDALRSVAPVVRWAPWFAAALAAMSGVLIIAGNVSSGLLGLVAAASVAIIVPWQARLLFRDTLPANQRVRACADEFALRLEGAGSPLSELSWAALRGWQETDRGSCCAPVPAPTTSTRARHAGVRPVYSVPHRAFALPADEHSFRELFDQARRPRRLRAARRAPHGLPRGQPVMWFGVSSPSATWSSGRLPGCMAPPRPMTSSTPYRPGPSCMRSLPTTTAPRPRSTCPVQTKSPLPPRCCSASLRRTQAGERPPRAPGSR